MEESEDGPVSGPVTMQKFNKRPKGQLRKKRADSDEEGAPAAAPGAAGSASAVVKKVKKVAEKKKSSLSFDTEEAGAVEEDAFASKKRAAGLTCARNPPLFCTLLSSGQSQQPIVMCSCRLQSFGILFQEA